MYILYEVSTERNGIEPRNHTVDPTSTSVMARMTPGYVLVYQAVPVTRWQY